MKESIRVRMNLVVDVDDIETGIPRAAHLGKALAEVVKAVVPKATYLHPGGRVVIGLTRESANAIRRAHRATK